MVFRFNWFGGYVDTIRSGDIFRPLEKYGGIISYHCHAEMGAWAMSVSSNGTWMHTQHIVPAPAGSIAIVPEGQWETWDSVIESMVVPKE